MTEETVFQLIAASLVLGLAAVLLDRINFPQKKFRPKKVVITKSAPTARDRTGAHVIDLDENEIDSEIT